MSADHRGSHVVPGVITDCAIPPSLPTYLPTYLPIYLPTHLPTYPPTYPSTSLPPSLPPYLPTSLPTYLPTSIYLSSSLPPSLPPIYLSTYPPFPLNECDVVKVPLNSPFIFVPLPPFEYLAPLRCSTSSSHANDATISFTRQKHT